MTELEIERARRIIKKCVAKYIKDSGCKILEFYSNTSLFEVLEIISSYNLVKPIKNFDLNELNNPNDFWDLYNWYERYTNRKILDYLSCR